MNGKSKKDFSSSMLVIAIIQAVITVFGLVVTFLRIFNASGIDLAVSLTTLIVYVLLIFYAVYGYKIPHGELMKYLYLIFGGLTAFIGSTQGSGDIALICNNILLILSTVLVAFMAGRLNRIEENEALSFIVIILLISSAAIGAFITKDQDWTITASSFNLLILFCSLFLCYSLKYELHKRAGKKKEEVARL